MKCLPYWLQLQGDRTIRGCVDPDGVLGDPPRPRDRIHRRRVLGRLEGVRGQDARCPPKTSCTLNSMSTGSVNEMPHKKWREIDLQPSCWLQLALPGWCLVSLLFL